MISKLRSFWADERGAYAMTFAIVAIPVIGAAAAAVEFSSVSKVRFHLQHALDTAALATAKELPVSDDSAYLQAYARNFFDANLNPVITPSEVTFGFQLSQVPGQGTRVILSANLTYDTYMAGVIGVEEIELDVRSVVAAGNRTIEIAIVVDNSGSMDTETGSSGYTRMEKAREAATQLINSLHTIAAYSNKPDPVRIAVVPFGSSVNVGPQYRGADWLDMRGWSSIHHQNTAWIASTTLGGDNWPGAYQSGSGWKSDTTSTSSVGPTPPSPLPAGITAWNSTWLSRWTLFDAIGVSWRGCVEMRPWPHHTTDAAPTDVTPDTLFVPMFAPDEPDRENSSEDADYGNSYQDDYIRVGPDYTRTTATYGSTTKQDRRQNWSRKYNNDARITVSGQFKFNTSRSRDLGNYGPNQGCTTTAITPLTDNKTTALNAISAMQPGGYTNVQEGIAWGWRVLSQGLPFGEGRGYDVPENDKILIVLTDGNNTFPSQSTRNETEYYPWGYGRFDRVGAGLASWSSNVNAMDQHTATTCANMKSIVDADGEAAYKIFTIAYDVPDPSTVKTLLFNCASISKKGTRYYYDVQGDALNEVMAAIGNEISQLRIAQ